MRNAATATTMMPMMTKIMSGLGKLLLGGGVEGDFMSDWMRDSGTSVEQLRANRQGNPDSMNVENNPTRKWYVVREWSEL
jgi:hypothetical protein